MEKSGKRRKFNERQKRKKDQNCEKKRKKETKEKIKRVQRGLQGRGDGEEEMGKSEEEKITQKPK